MASISASTPHLGSDGSTPLKSQVGRKMVQVRYRNSTMTDLPERFKGTDDEEDVDDGTGVGNLAGKTPMFAQQSMYGMLAATQAKSDFHGDFQQDSESDSEGEEEDRTNKGPRPAKESATPSLQMRQIGVEYQQEGKSRPGDEKEKHRTRMLNDQLLGWDSIRERADAQGQDLMTQSQFLPPKSQREELEERPTSALRTDAPILDRKLRAMANAALEASTTSLGGRTSSGGTTSEDVRRSKTSISLPQVIANIFHFSEPEEVVSEYPCWYLQNVLLQGLMYITKKHVCFYAYLQKKSASATKTGHLGKLGKHSYRYRRYWFVLKGDTLSYFKASSEPYFPLGVVDLRYAISAELAPDRENDTTEFTVATSNRVYQYKADTPSAAKEWVKTLQKVIFRSHNDGDSVKISLPIESILDVERTEVVDFAETIKLRVIDNDETFAVDEYFFTFFSSGKDVIDVLTSLTDESDAKKCLIDGAISPLLKGKTSPGTLGFEKPAGPSDSTLSSGTAAHGSSPRLSGEHRKSSVATLGQPSVDRGRKSFSARSHSRSRSKSPISPSIDELSESFVTSSERPDTSVNEYDIDAKMSASQMLDDDHVFREPTLKMPRLRRTMPGSATVDRFSRRSYHSSRSSSSERVLLHVQPSARQQKEQSGGKRRQHLPCKGSDGSGETAEFPDEHLRPSDLAAPKRVRGIPMPLQHAMTVAGMVKSSSKRVGSYMSSSPKHYISNWTEAIVGGKRHYTHVEGLAPDDSVRESEQDLNVAEHERRFHEHFGLPPTEKLVSVFYCWLHKTVPLYGKIYMGSRRFCFRSLWYGTKTKLIIPYKDILNVQKQRGFRWGYPGMIVVIRGYEELFFDFPRPSLRDDCVVRILRDLETTGSTAAESRILTQREEENADDAAAENELLHTARKDEYADHDPLDADTHDILFDDPSASIVDFTPKHSMRITCVTIGSRGDVQPYIALCKGLLAEGHKPKIATHAEFKDWVEKHGLEFAEVEGDPAELMRICVENGMFTPSFFLEANSKFRTWLDGLLASSWKACQDADLIIESPSAMSGIHIAEALEVPYFRAFTMPWTRTRTYPHAFAVPNQPLGGAYNYMTYTLFDNMFWQAIAGQINRWRGKMLGLGPTSLDRLQQNKVPFLYNFSPSVVTPPLDFSDWIKVTGYWFLDEGVDYQPPEELATFIKNARYDNQKLVYIGFGSVTVTDSRQLMQQIVDAVVKADVRCILSKGWSDRFEKKDAPDIVLPPCIHQIRAAPHDWLFKQVDAVVHHGGAGTTGASLRVGVPTIIKPFFGDQFFFATRVEDLGVGIHLKKVTGNQLGKALWIATHDTRMRTKARGLGKAIVAESGVKTAINAIYRDLDYARSLIKKRQCRQLENVVDGTDMSEEDTEENWTFVEKEGDTAGKSNAIAAFAMDMRGSGLLPRRSSSQSMHGQ